MYRYDEQIKEIRNWATNIEALARKGIDKDLLAELHTAGPGINSEVSALASMSNVRLAECSNLWKRRFEVDLNAENNFVIST